MGRVPSWFTEPLFRLEEQDRQDPAAHQANHKIAGVPSLPQGLCCRSEEEKGHQKERNPIRNTTELDRASLEVPMILFSLSSIRLWIYRLQLSSIVIIINKKHSFFSCRQNLRLCCGLAHTSEPTCTDGPPVSVALVSPSPSGVCLRTLEEEPVSRRALHRYSV